MKRSIYLTVILSLVAFTSAIPNAAARDKDKDKDKDCKKCEEQIKYCDFEPLICALEDLEKCDFLSSKKACDQQEDLVEWAEDAEEEAKDCDRKDALKKLGKIVRRIDGLDCDDWLTEDAADYISEIVLELLDCLEYDPTQCPHQDEEECKDKKKCDHKECRGKDYCKKEACDKCGEKHKGKDCDHD